MHLYCKFFRRKNNLSVEQQKAVGWIWSHNLLTNVGARAPAKFILVYGNYTIWLWLCNMNYSNVWIRSQTFIFVTRNIPFLLTSGNMYEYLIKISICLSNWIMKHSTTSHSCLFKVELDNEKWFFLFIDFCVMNKVLCEAPKYQIKESNYEHFPHPQNVLTNFDFHNDRHLKWRKKRVL